MSQTPVEIRRSARRRRTVSARREGDRIVVLLPAGLSSAQEKEWVTRMVAKVEKAGRAPALSDEALLDRARRLSEQFLGGRAQPTSVRWVDNQEHRWGSCTPTTGTIRVSSRLEGMPAEVIDYVVVHELTHLLEANHGPRFWALVGRYPRMDYARGYLDGVSRGAGWQPGEEADDVVNE